MEKCDLDLAQYLKTAIAMTRFHVSREEIWRYFEYLCLGFFWMFYQVSRYKALNFVGCLCGLIEFVYLLALTYKMAAFKHMITGIGIESVLKFWDISVLQMHLMVFVYIFWKIIKTSTVYVLMYWLTGEMLASYCFRVLMLLTTRGVFYLFLMMLFLDASALCNSLGSGLALIIFTPAVQMASFYFFNISIFPQTRWGVLSYNSNGEFISLSSLLLEISTIIALTSMYTTGSRFESKKTRQSLDDSIELVRKEMLRLGTTGTALSIVKLLKAVLEPLGANTTKIKTCLLGNQKTTLIQFSDSPDYRLLNEKITAIRLSLENHCHPDPEIAKKQREIANSIAILSCSDEEIWRFFVRNDELAVMFALAKGMCLSEAKAKIEEFNRRLKSTQERWIRRKPTCYNNWLETLNLQVIINQMMNKSIIVVINPARYRDMWKDFLRHYFERAVTVQRY